MEATLLSTPTNSNSNANTTIKKYYSVKSSQNTSSNLNDNWIMDDPNINQLDTLLQDLKSERDISREKDLFESSRSTSNYKTIEYDTAVRDTKPMYPESKSYYSKQEEILLDSLKGEPQYKTVSVRDEIVRDTKNQLYSPASTKTAYYTKKENIVRDSSEPQYKTITMHDEIVERKTAGDKNVSYDYNSGTNTLSSTKTSKSIVEPYILSNELENLPLSDDILPIPGTKVTTTVRTYTYEVPSDNVGTIKRDVFVKDVSSTVNRQNDEFYQIDRSRSPQHVDRRYNYEENITKNSTIGGARPPVPTVDRHYNYEENITKNSTISAARPPVPTVDRHYNYEENITNHSTIGTTRPLPVNKTVTYTTKSSKYIDQNEPLIPDEGTHTTHYITKRHVIPADHPDSSTTNTYYFNNQSNTTTTHSSPPYPPPHSPRTPQTDRSPKPIVYSVESTTNLRNPNQPVGSSVTTYNYSSTSTNTTSDNRSPHHQPQPFPVYGQGPQLNGTQPPKHLNDLLTSLDNGHDTSNTVVDGYHPKTEVETAVAKDYQQKIPSKNVAGSPVYYPPNHEMTLRKEESSAGYRAGGGWAKARGKYEYEAESKSKSKSSSGGAVVPVCLPLCCAMPCSIM